MLKRWIVSSCFLVYLVSACATQSLKSQLHAELLADFKQAISQTTPTIVVVIDPGHGGKDPGATGPAGHQEKQIVLAIAKRLATKINALPNMRAVLTRNNDYFVPLRKRLDIARKADPDVFIAIHADAYFNSARGASVFALSQHGATSEAAHWLAKQENYSELGDIAFKKLTDSRPVVRSVLIDLAQTATIKSSMQIGQATLAALKKIGQLHETKVERAPFVVLKSPDIPSILIEVGFITNREEEKKLATPAYQNKLAQAITTGLQHYARLQVALQH